MKRSSHMWADSKDIAEIGFLLNCSNDRKAEWNDGKQTLSFARLKRAYQDLHKWFETGKLFNLKIW